MSAVIHGPGEGERHAAGPAELVIKVTGEETAGTFFFCENVADAGFPGPPLHRHAQLHDMFYVLEGTLTFTVGEERQRQEAGPGTFVCVPPGVAHTFCNAGDGPARFLNFSTPSGWEHYMRELVALGRTGRMTPEAMGEIASRHDFEIVA